MSTKEIYQKEKKEKLKKKSEKFIKYRYYKIKTSFYHKRVKDLLFKIRKISLFSTYNDPYKIEQLSEEGFIPK